MQNKGAVKFFAITLVLVCLFQLSFTLVTKFVEKDARDFAKGNPAKEAAYLDSISGEVVYNIGVKKYTYKECKERELNLGLDLKGGMNVTLEISLPDLIRSMSDYSTDSTFNKAIANAKEMEKSSTKDFVTLFAESFKKVDPNARLAAIFSTPELKDKINFNSTDAQVLAVIRKETSNAIDNSFNILRSRIDRFGVVQPNIQKLQNTGRILVELPGIKDPERVRKLLQGSANLEFWETYENSDIYKFLLDANNRISDMKGAIALPDSLKGDSTKHKGAKAAVAAKKGAAGESALLQKIQKDTSAKDSGKGSKKTLAAGSRMDQYPLFSVLRPNVTRDNQLIPGDIVGMAHYKDTAKVNYYLHLPQVAALFPKDLKFYWSVKPPRYDKSQSYYELHAIKITTRDGRAPMDGSVVTDARKEFGQTKSTAQVTMAMNGEGSRIWARLTKENIGKCIAIVLDGYVYSSPRVQSEIKGGRSEITGDFTINEAEDLANILKSGKMPAPAKIVQEAVVGPSLGRESINAGMLSFIIGFIGVLLYMSLYYNGAGHVADIALIANVFYLFGVLASLGAVLTLPGIAGMVLTLAMAVDGNVIIYERMREEWREGKGPRLMVQEGFQHAYSSIIDGHVTTILTGVVLYIFGSGPVQGFATTLIVGLLLSLFSSIFIARLMFEWLLDHNKEITLGNKFTINALSNVHINFIGIRKIMYVASGTLISIGIISLIFRGLDPSVEFTGGRTYVVRFDRPVETANIRSALTNVFKDAPEVKTFGSDKQTKITTKYMIDNKSTKADSIVDKTLYEGLKPFFVNPVTYQQFSQHSDTKKVGELSSTKVDPVISNDLIWQSFMAVFFGLLIIFIYIAIRFKNWKYGLGGVISLFHDTMVVITMFTLFYGILPFSLEIDQQFIAALLTIIGYSIMDSVIIFDRIREYTRLYPKRDLETNINAAINSTLGRTINTSGVTLVVLIIIFIFGGEILRGFIFALLVGVAIGTYSSVFNATPIAYDLIKAGERKKARLAKALGKKN
ncbi:MAG: protein translocase subunit SecDF [Bacteroidota bacterium]|nr:protein translocase subunit SecDF [Bacteroidota bacterium]